jgi:hypothetical protein
MKMKPNALTIFLSITVISSSLVLPAHAETDSKFELGRLQICKTDGPTSSSNVVEFPVDGKFSIPATKVGTKNDIIITQSDVVGDAGSDTQPVINKSLQGQISVTKRDGKTWVSIDLHGQECAYLNASAPLLDRAGLTLSGTHVVPDWQQKDGSVSYRYFNSIDQTIYVASNLGNTLNFVTHDFSTGSNLSHDRNSNVANTNKKSQNIVPSALVSVLSQLGQYDNNLIDLEKYNVNVKDYDVDRAEDVRKLVGLLVTAVHPAQHARLLLALPVKGRVQMKFTNTALVGNRFEGMGYYRDSTLSVVFDSDHNDYVPIVAFVNFKVVLIDIDTATLIATKTESETQMFHRPPFPLDDPMSALDSYGSIQKLNAVTIQGMSKALATVLTIK